MKVSKLIGVNDLGCLEENKFNVFLYDKEKPNKTDLVSYINQIIPDFNTFFNSGYLFNVGLFF